MQITKSLKIEHQLLRQMMEAMSRWIAEGVEPDKLRERAVTLEAAINCHWEREERQLYAPLNDHSDIAHDLVMLVERVHLEVRKLFEALADPTSEPKDLLPKIKVYISAHFSEEETALFALAEKLLRQKALEDNSPNAYPPSGEESIKITELLEAEHEFLRSLMETFSEWITDEVAPDKQRERAAMLEIAIDDHAVREEKLLFEPLAACSTKARELIGLMEMVHVEVRDLFEQVADPARETRERLWTILMLTDEHFTKEETGVFPMAERLLDAEVLRV